MANDTRGERLQIMLTPEELNLLDDFRFKRRMPSRAAAVRELLRRGIASEGFSAAPSGSKSTDFGVGANGGGGANGSGGGANGSGSAANGSGKRMRNKDAR